MDQLPTEIVLSIASHLSLKDLLHLRYTSRDLFTTLGDDDKLWQAALHDGLPPSALRYNVNLSDAALVQDKQHDQDPRTCQPYRSYLELYLKVIRPQGWKIGTWLGNAMWFGCLYEIAYDPSIGRLKCSILEPWALWGQGRSYSTHEYIFLRDFEPFLEIQPSFAMPISSQKDPEVHETFIISKIDTVPEDNETMDGVDPMNWRSECWPPFDIPSTARVYEQDWGEHHFTEDALARVGENMMVLSMPIPNRGDAEDEDITSDDEWAGIDRRTNYDPHNARERELCVRINPYQSAPHGFEDYCGLFMGDYSGHGPEVLLLFFPTPTSLRAVKITGDPNVPSGETSWVIDDLNSPLRICQEREWHGAKSYAGRGQISPPEFSEPTWIETEIILYRAEPGSLLSSTSITGSSRPFRDLSLGTLVAPESLTGGVHNQEGKRTKGAIALWWKDMAHISRFHKVDTICTR